MEIKSFSRYISEHHHLIGGENSLDDLAIDLVKFIRWKMKHTSARDKQYDPKKYTLFYRWDFQEITEWFASNGEMFHYPVFLTENGSTISVKVSVARLVKGRRKEHDSDRLTKTFGNERASHATKKLNKSGSRNHVIYINAYHLSREAGKEPREFIESPEFEHEMRGTVKHEFMHAYDTYRINGAERESIDLIKKTYKDYRKANSIGKEEVTLKPFGRLSGNNIEIDTEYTDSHLRDFWYIMLYYVAKTEMNAYLQTFSNQMSAVEDLDPYGSDIYRRYVTIKRVLQHEPSETAVSEMADDRFRKDFVSMFPKTRKAFAENDQSRAYRKLADIFIDLVDKYLHKMHTILYDIRSMKE